MIPFTEIPRTGEVPEQLELPDQSVGQEERKNSN